MNKKTPPEQDSSKVEEHNLFEHAMLKSLEGMDKHEPEQQPPQVNIKTSGSAFSLTNGAIKRLIK